MARIFLSHSNANNAEAVALRDWLASQGWDDVFLDLDPERGLKAGERWQAALKRAAERCELVIFLVSPAWAASKWCLAEFLLAKNLNKRIFGVIVEPVAFSELPIEMTAEWQLVDLTVGARDYQATVRVPPGDAAVIVAFGNDGLNRLRLGLARAGLEARYFAWPPESDLDRPPYRGLRRRPRAHRSFHDSLGRLRAPANLLTVLDGVKRASRDWAANAKGQSWLAHSAERLRGAENLLARADLAASLEATEKAYILACQKLETAGRRSARRTQAFIYTLMLSVIIGLVAFINQEFLKEQYFWRAKMVPSVLTAAEENEKAAKPGPDTTIKDCAIGCPTMIVVAAGRFIMGTANETGFAVGEAPQHEVTIARPFAAGRTEVTFAEYDQCVAADACYHTSDGRWGRDDRPAINVSWEDAKR